MIYVLNFLFFYAHFLLYNRVMFLKIKRMLNGNHFMRTLLLTRVRDPDEPIHVTFPEPHRSIKQFTTQEKRIFKRKTPFAVVRLYGNHWLVLRGFYDGYVPKTCRHLRDVTTDLKNMDSFVMKVLTNHAQYISHNERDVLWKRYNALHNIIKRYFNKIA